LWPLTRRQQLKLWRAFAGVGPVGVDAAAVLARLRVFALVDVGAVASGLVERVPAVAHATEDAVLNSFNFKKYFKLVKTKSVLCI
jgi:hypothetical protein